MAKKSAVETNNRRKKLIANKAETRAKLKAMTRDPNLTMEERFAAQLKLAKMPRNSSKVRHRNRCEVSGRPRAVYRKFNLSRIALRDLASNGQIPGMVKSSF